MNKTFSIEDNTLVYTEQGGILVNRDTIQKDDFVVDEDKIISQIVSITKDYGYRASLLKGSEAHYFPERNDEDIIFKIIVTIHPFKLEGIPCITLQESKSKEEILNSLESCEYSEILGAMEEYANQLHIKEDEETLHNRAILEMVQVWQNYFPDEGKRAELIASIALDCLIRGYKEGYNAVPKGLYTEEDLQIVFGLGAANNANGKPSFEEVKSSLKPKPTSITLNMDTMKVISVDQLKNLIHGKSL